MGGEVVGEIGRGLLALVGAEEGDGEADVRYTSEKIAGLRVFDDADGKMNLSVGDVGGEVLLVSQFTLLGDVRRGKRPSFIRAARPEAAAALMEDLRRALEGLGCAVETGVFRAEMMVELVNDGPVTILLDSGKLF